MNNNIPIRINRGLFENSNVFNSDDRETIFLNLLDTKFRKPVSVYDNKFKFHPDLHEDSYDTKLIIIKEKCLEVLKSSIFVSKFCGTDNFEVLRYFILEYKNPNKYSCFNTGLDYHIDHTNIIIKF